METDTLLKLALLGKDMVEVYGCPLDIEFAVSNLEIYILQARPITTLHRYTDWEISHEFDSPRPSEKEIWTKANLGEVVPGAMTPLTRSTLIQAMDRILQLNTSLKENNPRFYSPYSWSWIQTIQHHNVLDVINGVLRWPESNLSFVSKAVDYAVFGHEVTSQAMLDTALHRHGGRDDVTTNLNLIRDMLTHTKIHNLEKDKFDELEFLQQIQKLKCPKQILAKIDTQWNLLARITYVHIKNSELSSAYQTIVFLIISGGKDDLTPQILQDIANILTLDDSTVESAGVPTGLNKLYVEIITKDDWKEGFAEASLEEAESWIKTNLSSSYRKFLDLFGHRCLKEFDLSVKPWREDASPIIGTLQSMLNTTRSQVPGQEKKEKKSCGFMQEKIINLILPLAHGSVARREESKSLLIKLTDILRQGYSILADYLKFTGLLIDSSDIFYLTHAEIHQLVYKDKRSLVVKAGRRKKILPTLNELQFPEMIDFQTFDPSQVCENSSVPVTEGNSLHGTPACSGTVKGLARVVTRLQDAKSIQPGEILITTSTDIGWSPYFPMLGGVVTELGGLISHGAVVARLV
ncbi:uncharacterized protein LOC111697188 isoform X2 [Eurytemora carolleeae]|uniref:uncharacterized protein LOC111697188 isoform X2 n=1 Tax=Eurytemora carolleeae TaxID=1294199 RepID=UPI000C78E507|nr:uncharacterized protein LOC111697188 isoform X2 [Eurytemora carolleeae]|eukprot:XP_023322862.1 uncharacterized protein LOC111697188 isoform X2 [Eurytemora affinis]